MLGEGLTLNLLRRSFKPGQVCDWGGAGDNCHTCLITIGRLTNMKHQQLTQQEATSRGSAEALIGWPVAWARCIFSLHRYGNRLRFFTPSTERRRERGSADQSVIHPIHCAGHRGRQIHQISILLMMLLWFVLVPVLLLGLVLELVFVSVLV